MKETLEEKKIRLAERISEVEKIPFSEAAKMIPASPEELKRLVDRLNNNHGRDRSPDGQRIARATKLAREEGVSFNAAARRVR